MSGGGGDFTQRKHRREPMELQLTAMIDVFSMIVIFLIFGTVFGASEAVIPPDVRIPFTRSKEGLEVAPRLVIGSRMVETNVVEAKYPLELFRARDGSGDGAIAALKAKLKVAIDQTPARSRASGILLNVIADQATPYEDVFSVIKVFREAGYTTLLFVAAGEGGGK